MKVRVAGLSLASILIVLVASTPRAQNAAPDPAFFQTQVFPVFEAAKCSGCHSPSASRLRRVCISLKRMPARRRCRHLGCRLSAWWIERMRRRSLLLTKPTNVMRHTGGVAHQARVAGRGDPREVGRALGVSI